MQQNNFNKKEEWVKRWHQGRNDPSYAPPTLQVFHVKMKMLENKKRIKWQVEVLSIAAAVFCCLIIAAIIRLDNTKVSGNFQGLAKTSLPFENSVMPITATVPKQTIPAPLAKNPVSANPPVFINKPVQELKDSIAIPIFSPLLVANKFAPDTVNAVNALQKNTLGKPLVRKGELLYYVHLKENQKNQDSFHDPVRTYDPPPNLMKTSNKVNTGDIPIHQFNH